ncbi:MAG: SGNH/GDSL hydrolase family protein [Gemmataceae bacterium]
MPFVVLELLCRLFGWGLPTEFDDPFVGFSDVHPLFVLNEDTRRYEIPQSRLKFFCPESFSAEKPSDRFRIFVLGGSTVQGRPYEKETSFTSWLEISLNVAAPERHWRVINCGGVSYASYRLIPILKEVLEHDPDMIIVCTGHNEFLEDRSYSHIKAMPALVAWPTQQVMRLRTYNILRSGALNLTKSEKQQRRENIPELPAEVNARLDYKGGIEKYHRDENWRKNVMDHFTFNLRQMEAIARTANVPLVFVLPVAKLDCEPFKSEHRTDFPEADHSRFAKLLNQARVAPTPDQAIDHLEAARDMDDRVALVHYLLGRAYRNIGRLGEAKRSFERAMDEDICPLRMLSPMRKTMLAVAKETKTPLINLQDEFATVSPGGITGNRWLIDHVHPTIKGHQLVAEKLVNEFTTLQILRPKQGWRKELPEVYTAFFTHLKKDKPLYFTRAANRLKGVKTWSFGNVRLERE